MKTSMLPDNKYSFQCPTLNKKAMYIVCAFVRHKHWRGERTSAKECHYAMRCGKCPAAEMIKQEEKQGGGMFISANPDKLHALDKEILAKVNRTLFYVSPEMGGIDPKRLKEILAIQRDTLRRNGWSEKHVLELDIFSSSMVSHSDEGVIYKGPTLATISFENVTTRVTSSDDAPRRRGRPPKNKVDDNDSFLSNIDTDMTSALNNAMQQD